MANQEQEPPRFYHQATLAFGGVATLGSVLYSAEQQTLWEAWYLGSVSPPFPATLTQTSFIPHLIGR